MSDLRPCPSCGHENPLDARFCNRCGSPIAPDPVSPEQLKTVTVRFADVTGSTALAERLTSEAVRRVMERYFDLAQRVITRHGGTVEKFIGDAVMAVFGVPVLHEDDALRAVRAAAELRSQLPVLNEELLRDYDATLELRIGINTGESVTAGADWLAAGDAVNTAARLEQAAAPGEILLGHETFRLAHDAVSVEPLEPLSLRGKSEPFAAYRLAEVRVGAGTPPRRLDTPMIGRAPQLRMLEDAFGHAVRERSCSLFTVLGTAGVGKSRLAAEFLAGVDATVVRGRCLSYGEGITYWPVTEVVRQVLADPAIADVASAGSDKENAAIRSLLGESEATGTAIDIAWAVRKLFERAASTRTLVVVFDDVHWGEQTFLDLVEHVADLSRGAPILLLCMGRPELLDRRPAWGGGKLNATTVLLEPLGSTEADELIDRLLPAGASDEKLRARVLEVAAGNPLFLEEMAAVVTSAEGAVAVPPTIQALLAARLDQLEPVERGVLECGSVEGNSFHRSAIEALGHEESGLDATLVTLVRKDLVRPEPATLSGDDAFRFRHLLIRDAAYDRLPKSVRARLHQRFAEWLDERARELAELDEIVGYHLEQAYRYRRELGPSDPETEAVASAAANRLEAAGRRALEREDATAALSLLDRASALLADRGADIALEVGVLWALYQVGRMAEAAERAAATSRQAAEAGDTIGALRAELVRMAIMSHLDPEGRIAEIEVLVERARPLFEQAGDDAALGSLHMAIWHIEHFRCRFGAAADAAMRAVEHTSAAGDRYLASWARTNAAAGVALGPTPVEDGLAWLDQQEALLDPTPSWVDFWRVHLLPLIGSFDEARALYASNVRVMTEQGERLGLALSSGFEIEMEIGQFEKAETAARRACQLLEEMDDRSFWSTKACELAEALYRQGRYEEAEAWARRGAEAGASDDVVTQLLSRQVLAMVAARAGQAAAARTLAAEALAIAATMDSPLAQGEASMDVAETLGLIGDREGALEQGRRAADFFERKGATVPLERARLLAKEVARST